MSDETGIPGLPANRALIVGTGLIGGSIGLALRERGWFVTGRDRDPERAERARQLGALDEVGDDAGAAITFVATPVAAIAGEVAGVLAANPTGFVTDVGGVKSPLMAAMDNPRFVGGHPMAGSELEGVDGARADLFEGRTWVLTPVETTDDEAFTRVRSVVTSLGAEVVAIPPQRHDSMVAVVSHVPHLVAATLMRLAAERSVEHRPLLLLAAGGFRDMTRIASGHPGIWPDICGENRAAIIEELDRLVESLGEMRDIVATGERDQLVARLESARHARLNLPARFARPDELAELRVPIPDRAGELARITTLATELGVSVVDIEIAHSAEGDEGVLILVVERALGERLQGGLMAHGYHPSLRPLE